MSPHSAEFTLGLAEGKTRGLHAGYAACISLSPTLVLRSLASRLRRQASRRTRVAESHAAHGSRRVTFGHAPHHEVFREARQSPVARTPGAHIIKRSPIRRRFASSTNVPP